MSKMGRKQIKNMGKQNNAKRKAQLEMIGLVMIVIIVITALLIFMVYKISNPSKNIQKRYTNKEIATNMLITIPNTDVAECHNISLSSLITDCARSYHSIWCGDNTSCEIANQTVFDILNRTLIDWGVSFNLTIEGTNISHVAHDCTSSKEKIQSYQVLPLDPGEIEITLDICLE